jgi:hypothetical protein
MWESELVVEKGNKQLELLTIALASSSSLGNYINETSPPKLSRILKVTW